MRRPRPRKSFGASGRAAQFHWGKALRWPFRTPGRCMSANSPRTPWGMTACRTQQCVPRYACQARNRATEPDFEIFQERKYSRCRGQRRKTSFSQSGSRGGPAPRPADCREPYWQFEPRSVFPLYQRLAGGGKGTGIKPSLQENQRLVILLPLIASMVVESTFLAR